MTDLALRAGDPESVSVGPAGPAEPGEPTGRPADPSARLRAAVEAARLVLGHRAVWNVSASGAGDGGSELLSALAVEGRSADEPRWRVLSGDPAFFGITKRVQNFLHGSVGDAGRLDDPERRHYESVLADALAGLAEVVRSGDVVVLHDPPTAGLAPGLRELGAHVVWRSHLGSDVRTRVTDAAWSFLRPYVEEADAVVFARASWAPRWLDPARGFEIAPSLDPFSPRNRELTPEQVEATLRAAGIIAGNVGERFRDFTRSDGSPGRVRRHVDAAAVMVAGDLVPVGERYVLQLGRWDRLEDTTGVIEGFVSGLRLMPPDVHLVLAGPKPGEMRHDPEATKVAEECLVAWRALPTGVRRRIHLCWLPTDDADEHAHIVNALQRHAGLVVHKCLAEGFGLTVTEAMWKERCVLATRVGGIPDQIADDENGMLLDDPRDLDSLGAAIALLMRDNELRVRLGIAARETVSERYLGDRHLAQYAELFAELLG
jgi:trehalose synthase